MRKQRPVRFRLYPESRRGLYALVVVHPNAKAMRRYARRTGDAKSSGRYVQGYCACYRVVSFHKRRRPRTQPLFAEVHLHRNRLTMGVVTHELLHATIQWGRRIGFDFRRLHADDSINQDEERLTYAHGQLCRDFMIRANALGLYSNLRERR